MHLNRRQRARAMARLAICSVLAATATLVLADVASAKIPERTIRSHCRLAEGTYETRMVDGQRRSYCTYRDINGDYWMDKYINGEYVGTY